jgi:hypothetical protein
VRNNYKSDTKGEVAKGKFWSNWGIIFHDVQMLQNHLLLMLSLILTLAIEFDF